jgi:hypothetical protein
MSELLEHGDHLIYAKDNDRMTASMKSLASIQMGSGQGSGLDVARVDRPQAERIASQHERPGLLVRPSGEPTGKP